MELDTDNVAPTSQPASIVAPPTQLDAGNHTDSNTGNMFASTYYLPTWAQPAHHYSFGAYQYPSHPLAYYPYTDSHYHPAVSLPGAAAAELACDAPPLPPEAHHETAPLPPEAASSVSLSNHLQPAPAGVAAAVPAKRREYHAEPVRAAPLPSVSALAAPAEDIAAAAEAALAAALPDERKRKRDKSAAVAVGAKAAKSGKVSALMNKWSAVRQDLNDEERARAAAEEAAFDADALERRKQLEIEEWRMQQLRSGQAGDNPNFQPLAVADWRERLLGLGSDNKSDDAGAKASKQSKSHKKAKRAKGEHTGDGVGTGPVSEQYPTNSKARPDLDALSVGLPAGWRAMWDKGSGDIYYGNPTTKVWLVDVSTCDKLHRSVDKNNCCKLP